VARVGVAVASVRAPLLLYDGTCGVCARSVQFLLRRDRRRRTLRFAALESPLGTRILAHHPQLAGVDSLVWIDPDEGPGEASAPPGDGPAPSGRALARSDAVLAAARYLGGGWALLAAAGALVPRGIRDALYDLVARNRHRVLPRNDRCLLPTPEERARFLDGPDAPGSHRV
jgi:predicted DCC family thiol-disulfide oxidoreductase YuxK